MKNELMMKITQNIGKVKLNLKKVSPEICLVAGIGLGVAATVTACMATLKVNNVVEEAKDTVDKIHESAEHGANPAGIPYSEEDKNRDLVIIYTQTAVKSLRLYGPSIILGGASIACLIGGHNILQKRNVALAATCTAIEKAFSEYRKRVADRYGEEVDKELQYGFKKKTVTETVTDEDGNDKQVEKEVVVKDDKSTSPYSIMFDSVSREWQKDAQYNLMFLKRIQAMANDRLRANGYLFMNDVLYMLDLPESKIGQVVGWVYDQNNPSLNNFVDLGLSQYIKMRPQDLERDIEVTFNVDGNIFDAFESYDTTH